MKTNCRSCYTYIHTRFCGLYFEAGELCICGNCIVKMMCKEKCARIVKFYRQKGILHFNKSTGIAINHNKAIITKPKPIKLKGKTK